MAKNSQTSSKLLNLKKVDPTMFTEKIESRNIAVQSEIWQKIFGANKNLYRYFPSLIDGLKPVERRFLYSLYNDKRYHGRQLKLARASANTVEFHPHGDSSISDVAIGMSQQWVNNVPLVFTEGNNGSIKGDAAAAPRYLDVCISDFAYDCYFSDFKNSSVDMRLSYTGESYEPITLPAKYPVAIINGGFSSIGYGFSSNIPPYNFKEVCEAVIKLIQDPSAKIIMYPDLPSGADIIMTKKEAKEIFEKAEHDVKIKMRATANIDYINNTITFTSIPMQTSTQMIISAINNIRMSGGFDEIKEINDYTTDKDGIGLMLEIVLNNKDSQGNAINPDKVLEKLYKNRTGLKKTNACSITLIDEFVSNDYSIRKFLLNWIDYRRDVVRASLNNKLANLLESQHINDIKIFLCKSNNSDTIIDISKKSKNVDEYREKLMKKFNITSLQAKIIAGMPTSSFNEDSRKGFMRDAEELEAEIKKLSKIIESDSKVDKVIIEEMEEGIKKYGRERLSKVINDENEIVDNSCIIGITEDGYVKKVLKSDKTIGHVSKNSNSMMMAMPVMDTDSLLIFDSTGGKHLVQASAFPLLKEKNNGLEIRKFINIPKGAKVVSASVIPKNISSLPEYFYIMITKKGIAKRVSSTSLLKNRNTVVGSTNAIILNDNDELSVVLCSDTDAKDIIIFTDYGDGMRLPVKEIPLQLPGSKGTKVITLKGNESILGANLMNPEDKYLVYVTSTGKVKRTELKYFPIMKKKDEPLCLVNLESGEYLVSVKSVVGKETLMFFKKKSESETIKVKDIPIKTRAAKADKMLKTPKGDVILSMVIK